MYSNLISNKSLLPPELQEHILSFVRPRHPEITDENNEFTIISTSLQVVNFVKRAVKADLNRRITALRIEPIGDVERIINFLMLEKRDLQKSVSKLIVINTNDMSEVYIYNNYKLLNSFENVFDLSTIENFDEVFPLNYKTTIDFKTSGIHYSSESLVIAADNNDNFCIVS